ncbi:MULTISPECIES: endolytic transglycosylase MltG [unclassified Microbacterium]|uniref:endolytic transglycosylase MltG n=1 Tax=unclassified Microbacterium TaxID=2609290 RepID=UPI00386E7598
MSENPPEDARVSDPADRPTPDAAPSSRRAAREARTPERPTPLPAASPAEQAATRPAPADTIVDDRRAEPVRPASLDALFEEQTRDPSTAAARIAKDRRKSRVAAWTIFLVILGIIAGIGAGALWVWTTYEDQIRAVMGWEEPKDFEPGLAEGEATITVVSNQTGADISRTLFDAGVIKTSDAFYDYLISSGADTNKLDVGVFSLQKKMTSEAAYEALIDPANKQQNTAQLREGLTVDQSLERIAEGVGLPIEEVQAAVAKPSDYGVDADTLEGWLFPATYTFNPGVTAAEVVQTMVDRTREALDDAGVPADRRDEILTTASIIEKEARYEKDFYRVSRVIQNRLDPAISETNGLLQMDSTAQYKFQDREGGASSRAEELEDDNLWNTYVHPGLPVGPIANPGAVAIDAAMNPEEGPWQYFVTVDLESGLTEFNATFAEHEQSVAKWRQWCRDNPDGGCS